MNYITKYLKYKTKYLHLKGGETHKHVQVPIQFIDKYPDEITFQNVISANIKNLTPLMMNDLYIKLNERLGNTNLRVIKLCDFNYLVKNLIKSKINGTWVYDSLWNAIEDNSNFGIINYNVLFYIIKENL